MCKEQFILFYSFLYYKSSFINWLYLKIHIHLLVEKSSLSLWWILELFYDNLDFWLHSNHSICICNISRFELWKNYESSISFAILTWPNLTGLNRPLSPFFHPLTLPGYPLECWQFAEFRKIEGGLIIELFIAFLI